ncbi:hypothetical protein [Litorivicinus lipolyticus]|uniref:hypothetical protein n=1 Tax=Litorivicinus lipolyticus TaxID=418701 RepID=UPI003B5CBFD7
MMKVLGLVLLVLVGSNAASVASLGLTATVLCSLDRTQVVYLDDAGQSKVPLADAPACDCWQRLAELDGLIPTLNLGIANAHSVDAGVRDGLMVDVDTPQFHARDPPIHSLFV